MCANHLPRDVRRGLILPACLAILLSAGCAPRAQVQLLQPSAPPMQQNIRLAADWAHVSADGARRECLLDFPLPNSKDGPRDFRLFLSLAATESAQSIDLHDPQAARGFLIQAVGSRKGKTVFTGGTVRLRPIPFDRRHQKLELDLTCEDGSQISGSAKVIADDSELRDFKRRFAADIVALDARVIARADEIVEKDSVSAEKDQPEPDRTTDGEIPSGATPPRSTPAE